MVDLESAKESSISVAVRIRPLTSEERIYLQEEDETVHDNNNDYDNTYDDQCIINKENIYSNHNFKNIKNNDNINNHNVFSKQPFTIKKILDVVDDRMLIFDPKPVDVVNYEGNNTNIMGSDNSRRSVSIRGLSNHNRRHKEHKFIFDKLFDENCTQNEVYENSTKPSIEAVLDGYNSTVFAYGATGCGKTYTITGTPDNPGIIFLAVKELFTRIENQNEKDISVQVSYLEIYNETIKDLLNIETSSRKLTLLENENKEIIVSNLTMVDTSSVEDVMDVILKGNYNRSVSPTAANETSSRSHAVIQVYITQTPHVSDIYEKSTRSVLSIIDLAGSERASATKNKGARLHEGANINKSLLALGNCINALCDSRRSKHIPYRDSKLTRLLKFSLGGNCKTLMIVCVSPSSRHYDETLNALKFANRAKEIKTKVVRNRTTVMKHVGSYMKIIAEQKRKIYELETLMDITVKREVTRYSDQRNSVRSQFKIMIERLWNNVNKCEHLKSNKIYIVAKRKILLIYTKQLTEFLENLEKFDIDNRIISLKQNLNKIISSLKLQINILENEYNQRTELDVILQDTSESFLNKLREIEGWETFDEDLYNREIDYLKTEIEKQIFYESSVLFDSWISESGKINNIDSIPGILAQYICMIESLANNIQTIEDARMQCYQLSDDLLQSCIRQLAADFDEYTTTNLMNHKKRKNSGLSNSASVDDANESSFIRQGNRVNSISNKLMRVNLNSIRDISEYKDSNIETLSEMESSMILDEGKNIRNASSRVRSSSQSFNLQSESTPQQDNNEDMNEFISPVRDTKNIVDIQTTIPEWEESNSSVIIRKNEDDDIAGSNNNIIMPGFLGSPLDFMNSMSMNNEPTSPSLSQSRKTRSHSGKLTTKKLIASPKITSPHRLVGLDSSSGNLYQLKLRESMLGVSKTLGSDNYDDDGNPDDLKK
ncbi:kinesin-like protein Klp5 [Pichia californica]|nr:kinesin-like protein Klp5 [[Candida] californica]